MSTASPPQVPGHLPVGLRLQTASSRATAGQSVLRAMLSTRGSVRWALSGVQGQGRGQEQGPAWVQAGTRREQAAGVTASLLQPSKVAAKSVRRSGRGAGQGVAGPGMGGKGLLGSWGRQRSGLPMEAGVWPAAVGSSWLIQPGQGGRKCASLEKGLGQAACQAGEEVPLGFVAGWGALGRGEAVGWEGPGSRPVSLCTPPSHPTPSWAGGQPPGGKWKRSPQ